MNGPTDPPKHDSLAALRQPNFCLFMASRTLSSTGQSLLSAVMAWQVYHISGSALDLGLMGMIRFFPALITSLLGGAAADAYNRRTIIVVAGIVPIASSVILAVASFGGWVRIELIFSLVLLIGLASAFDGPARAALLPSIVRPETFANAVTVNAALSPVGMTLGPLLAGVIIDRAGVGFAYATHSMLLISGLLVLLSLRYRPLPGSRRKVSIEAIREGVHFVRSHQILLGAMTLDLFAVIFGGAAALLPVYASDILHVGPTGYGALAASIQLGAFVTSLVLATRAPIERMGRGLIYAVIAYGFFTIAFGFSHNFALSFLLYMLIGASDQVSFVIRQTAVQLATPDALRGRVSAVYQIFTGATVQVGAMESGVVAALAGATFSVVSGGAAAISFASLVGWRMKELFNFRLPHPDAEGVYGSEAGSATKA